MHRPCLRPGLTVVLFALAVTLLAGCLSPDPAPAGGEGSTPEETESPAPGEQLLGRFYGYAPGVETVEAQVPTAAPVASGAVFTVDTGQALEDAIVAARCVLAEGTTAPELSAVTQTDEEGRFFMADLSRLLPCAAVSFHVQAAGYDMTIPLETDSVQRGVEYVVYAGMEDTG